MYTAGKKVANARKYMINIGVKNQIDLMEDIS